jgi:uncharacterized protein YndB with AHSA1/START domain
MPDFFELEAFVAAEPARVYKAWLDAREHALLTSGGETTVEPWVGGRFTAFDGYIHGIILGLDEGRRIVQTWRTVDFTPDMRDARVVVEFEPAKGGTLVRVRQTDTPVEQRARYEQGWNEHYLKRLGKHFARKRNEPEKPPTAKERATTWGRGARRDRPAAAAAAKKKSAVARAKPKTALAKKSAARVSRPKKAARPAARKPARAKAKRPAPAKRRR